MIINIYKPKTWTSFDVVAKLRGILGIKKIGHAGTLDPLAEGVLIILTDKDTKKQSEFMELKKEYRAKIAFGVESETYDLEGKLNFTSSGVPGLEKVKKELKKVIPNYIGQINQKVPPYSAVKVKGKRLYKKARKGNISKSELPVKKVTVYNFRVDSIEYELVQNKRLPVLTCTLTCSKGTYIRSIANDLGQDLGTGALLIDLIRTKIGEFDIKDSKTMDQIQKQL